MSILNLPPVYGQSPRRCRLILRAVILQPTKTIFVFRFRNEGRKFYVMFLLVPNNFQPQVQIEKKTKNKNGRKWKTVPKTVYSTLRVEHHLKPRNTLLKMQSCIDQFSYLLGVK